MTIAEAEVAVLAQLVRKYRVCWEVWPEYSSVQGAAKQTGFELELIGTHPPSVGHMSPGCVECRLVFSALVDIAEAIIPTDRRDSEYPIDGFDQSLRYAPERNNRPDVTLKIRIQHRSGFGPVDDCERRCLLEMEERLRQLGAPQKSWRN